MARCSWARRAAHHLPHLRQEPRCTWPAVPSRSTRPFRSQVEQVLFKPGVEYVEFLSFWRVVAVVWHACGGEHGTSFTDELETCPARPSRVVWKVYRTSFANLECA